MHRYCAYDHNRSMHAPLTLLHISNTHPHCLRPSDGHLQSPEIAERAGALMQCLLPRCLRFVRGAVKEISPSMDNNLVVAATRLLTALLLPDPDVNPAAKTAAGEFIS